MKQFLIYVMALLVWSCATHRLPPRVEKETITKVEVVEVPRDTIINVSADSSLYKALIECRNGKPVIIEREVVKGKYVQVPEVRIDSNVISIVSKAKAQQLFFEWKEKYIKENTQTSEVRTEIKKVEKHLSWWQLLWLNLGRIVGLCVIGYVIIKFIPWKNLLGPLRVFLKR